MLESSFELLPDLLLTALVLLVAVCIIGSVFIAVRAVSRGNTAVPWKNAGKVYEFVDAMRMTSPTTLPTEPELSEEVQYAWRQSQELERVGKRRTGSERSR
jgi:hypothetical protein